MKNVLILSSSPRKGGNSDILCDRFVLGATEAGHQVEKISLREKDLHFCTGCSVCISSGKCVQKDDVAEILEKMLAVDVIVLATPVYFYTMAAQLKMLIDRTAPCYLQMQNKEFYFIMTAADPCRENLERTVESLRGFTEGCLEGAVERGILYGTGLFNVGDAETSEFAEQAYMMGKEV